MIPFGTRVRIVNSISAGGKWNGLTGVFLSDPYEGESGWLGVVKLDDGSFDTWPVDEWREIVPLEATGDRHPNSQRFHELLAELGELHDRKQQDYGRGDDPFANVRSSTEWGVPAWVGAMVRANDKVRRLQSLIQNGKLENESAEDSLRDLAVYSIIALVLYEQEQEAA